MLVTKMWCLPTSENTHLLRKGNLQCSMAALLFDWLGFSCFAHVELDSDIGTILVESKPVKQEASHTVILVPLRCK